MTIVSEANYLGCVPAPLSTVDVAALATRMRIAVWRVARHLRGAAEADLSATSLAALGTIERHGPMTPGQFARHEQIRKPTATRTIAALVERGLVERTPDPLDGRVVWLQLTPDGRRILVRVRRRYDAFLAQRIKRLSGEEKTILDRAAGILEALMEPEVQP
jgi:DNA-binding MarR family transcriptional regulator